MEEAANPIPMAKLPNELLQEIFSYLDKASLRSVALTSKKTSPSANAILYETYIYHESPSKAPFALFLRTICERPYLAARVKRVDIRGWRSEFEVATSTPCRGMAKDKGKIATQAGRSVSWSIKKTFILFVEAAIQAKLIVKHDTYPDAALKAKAVIRKAERDFLRLLGHSIEDAHIFLPLALLPRLSELRVDGMTPVSGLDWYHFFSRSDTAPRRIKNQKLYGAFLKCGEPSVYYAVEFLDLLPNLEQICVKDVDILFRGNAPVRLPTSTLKSISLSNCGIVTNSL